MLPFRLKPYIKEVVWGGDRIAAFKGENNLTGNIGESWELSGMPDCESVVETGEFAGSTLSELCNKFDEKLLGKDAVERFGIEFPILVKFIDAKSELSIQVHPSDDIAMSKHGCRGKHEFWYIVDSLPGSSVIAGFKKPIDIEEFDRRVADGTITEVLAVYETHPGDIFYLPAGSIHAAHSGNFILEVQQPSNITYRIHDYDRVDASGNKRELHLDDAREAIDLNVKDMYCRQPEDSLLIDTRHFKVAKLSVDDENGLKVENKNFTAIVVISGDINIRSAGGESLTVSCGHSCIIPAGCKVDVCGQATLISITV